MKLPIRFRCWRLIHWSEWRLSFYIGFSPIVVAHFRIQLDLLFFCVAISIPQEWWSE